MLAPYLQSLLSRYFIDDPILIGFHDQLIFLHVTRMIYITTGSSNHLNTDQTRAKGQDSLSSILKCRVSTTQVF